MGRVDYSAMKTDPVAATELMNSDINELELAAKNLVKDVDRLGGVGFGTTVLKWMASFAAILVGVSWFPNPSSGCGSKLLCRNREGELDWCLDMSAHWMLPAARAHTFIRWFQSSFTQSHGISNTLGILLLLVYPVRSLVIHII